MDFATQTKKASKKRPPKGGALFSWPDPQAGIDCLFCVRILIHFTTTMRKGFRSERRRR